MNLFVQKSYDASTNFLFGSYAQSVYFGYLILSLLIRIFQLKANHDVFVFVVRKGSRDCKIAPCVRIHIQKRLSQAVQSFLIGLEGARAYKLYTLLWLQNFATVWLKVRSHWFGR